MAVYIEDHLPLVKYNGLNTQKGVDFSGASSVALPSAPTANSVIIPLYEMIADNQNQVAAASYAVSHTIFVNDSVSGTYKIAAIAAVFGTASTSGTLNVEVATGTQAIAAGTNQMSSTMSLSGTANTTVNGTITTQTTITAGSRINLIFAGTVTNLANASIIVTLQRLS